METNKITCGLCMDLIPLVRDGIASSDSKRAVELHIKTCSACRALYNEETPPSVNIEQALQKFQRQTQFFYVILMIFGIFFGVSLTAGANMFYNSLIMPVIGALGYILFRWKALYRVPVLLLTAHGLLNIFRFDAGTLFVWTALYSFFALLGVLIAGLLHYAFKKER